MKDQYFGDRRDYFKYDLAIFLAKNLSGIQRFTFIPMLTENDKSSHGRNTKYTRWQEDAPGLFDFLHRCIDQGLQSVTQLRTFFAQNEFGFEYCPYSDEQVFRHQERESYFTGIPSDFLDHAVVLADPDNGLEVKSMRPSTGHKYIMYNEVRNIYRRMSESSIFLIFQYFPRVQRQPYLERRFQEFRSRLECPVPLAVSDNEIAFIALTKSSESRVRVLELLKHNRQRNSRLWVFDAG